MGEVGALFLHGGKADRSQMVRIMFPNRAEVFIWKSDWFTDKVSLFIKAV